MPRVIVYRPSDRKYLYAQWVDPVSGRKKTRSTKTTHRREAERFAARLEADLESGVADCGSQITWAAFRRRYEEEVLAGQSPAAQAKERTTLNLVEEVLNPRLVRSIDASAISRVRAHLVNAQRAGFTIRGHLQALQRALRWACGLQLIPAVPSIAMPRGVKASRGRAVTTEEFDRLIDAVPKAVPEASVASWQWLLRGLWWSGLRLGEALALHWTDDRKLCVDLTGERPMFRIRAEGQKSRKDCLLPMAPEFAEMLHSIPAVRRRGLVFRPRPLRKPFDVPLRLDSTSKRITAIGKAAGIVVSHHGDRPKYASAHDLRRAFGFRWAHRVPAVTLQRIMRHESIQTTHQFYVRADAEAAADVMWSSFANKPANTGHLQNPSPESSGSQPVDAAAVSE